MFNGEVFSVSSYTSKTHFFDLDLLQSFDCVEKNDGVQLFKVLTSASSKLAVSDKREEFMAEACSVFTKAFCNCDMSFVYVDRVNDMILIYKDLYGKRSLVFHADQVNGELLISSTCLVPNA
jgi:hypothetical protein